MLKEERRRRILDLLRQTAIVDGGCTALALIDAIPATHTGTFITHSPPVAAALGRRPDLEVW